MKVNDITVKYLRLVHLLRTYQSIVGETSRKNMPEDVLEKLCALENHLKQFDTKEVVVQSLVFYVNAMRNAQEVYEKEFSTENYLKRRKCEHDVDTKLKPLHLTFVSNLFS